MKSQMRPSLLLSALDRICTDLVGSGGASTRPFLARPAVIEKRDIELDQLWPHADKAVERGPAEISLLTAGTTGMAGYRIP